MIITPDCTLNRTSAEIDVAPCKPSDGMTRQKRRVSFCDEVIAWSRKNPILDMEEIKMRWLQKDEIQVIKRHLNVTLSLLRSGKVPLDEDAYCTRGVEHLIDLKGNMSARRLVVDKVLTEQDLQQYEGIRDVELLAKASREFSAEHSDEGYLKGLNDQQKEGSVQSFPKILALENKLMRLKRMSAFSPLLRMQ